MELSEANESVEPINQNQQLRLKSTIKTLEWNHSDLCKGLCLNKDVYWYKLRLFLLVGFQRKSYFIILSRNCVNVFAIVGMYYEYHECISNSVNVLGIVRL